MPESQPADAAKRMASIAMKWRLHRQRIGKHDRIAVVHMGGRDAITRKQTPGIRKSHESTETGTNNLRLMLHAGLLRREARMIFMTNKRIPRTFASEEATRRYIMDRELKAQFMRFKLHPIATASTQGIDVKYRIHGKDNGSKEDDKVIPYVHMAAYLDYLMNDNSPQARRYNHSRMHTYFEPAKEVPPTMDEESIEMIRSNRTLEMLEPTPLEKQRPNTQNFVTVKRQRSYDDEYDPPSELRPGFQRPTNRNPSPPAKRPRASESPDPDPYSIVVDGNPFELDGYESDV